MRIMLIGASGQLGTELAKALQNESLILLSHADIEITDFDSVRKAFERHRPETVINTAAFIRVDECETRPETAFRVNATAARDLAKACSNIDATLVHFSTDCVFGGEKREPYVESDCPHPLSVYGASKLAGECLVRATHPKHFIIRTCGLYGLSGSRSKGGNFVESMLRRAAEGQVLRVVNDQVVSPTCARDLAGKVGELIRTQAYGLYHVANHGSCSWFDFASRILALEGVKADLRAVTSEEYAAPARRPAYSALRNARLESMGMDDLPSLNDALARYLRQRRTSADE